MLYDIAPKMLDVARARFQHVDGNFTVEEIDYRNLRCTDRFDAVISSLSIHHLENHEKRHLFSAIHACLREGGVFVNVDQIKAPTDAMRDLYWSTWLAGVREESAAENRIQASIQRRTGRPRNVSAALRGQVERPSRTHQRAKSGRRLVSRIDSVTV